MPIDKVGMDPKGFSGLVAKLDTKWQKDIVNLTIPHLIFCFVFIDQV